MHVRRIDTYIEALAPAKINLFLEVLAKRPDGFHEIETLMTAVTLFDSLIFIPRADGSAKINLECRWALGLAAAENAKVHPRTSTSERIFDSIPAGRENLVWRAIELLREQAGIQQGATVRLIKRIPAAAGLGGASSDAAAALVAASLGWRLAWPRDRLLELAAKLGSDVPFFLSGGAAVCRGRGEQVESVRVPRLHVAIVRPPVGLSTPNVYKACRPAASPAGVMALIEVLKTGDTAAGAQRMINGLQAPAASLTLWIDRLAHEFQRLGVLGHQMSGSGSSYYAICRHARNARRVVSRLRARKMGAAFAATSTVAS